MEKTMNRWLSEFDLDGRVAAITGAGGELCGAMARALGAMGVRVALLDLNQEAAEKNVKKICDEGGTANAWRCDVLDAASLTEAYESIVAMWGVPGILINGAGGNHPSGTTDLEFYNRGDSEDPNIKSFFDLDEKGI